MNHDFYQHPKTQTEASLDSKKSEQKIILQNLEQIKSGILKQLFSRNSLLAVWNDFEYYSTLSVNLELKKLLAARALAVGGAVLGIWSEELEIRQAQESALHFRAVQNLPNPIMIEVEHFKEWLNQWDQTDWKLKIHQTYPATDQQLQEIVSHFGLQESHTTGVLENGDFRAIYPATEIECRKGLESKYVSAVLQKMIQRGLPADEAAISRIMLILNRLVGHSKSAFSLNELVNGLEEKLNLWTSQPEDKIAIKFSRSASGFGTFLISKSEIENCLALKTNNEAGSHEYLLDLMIADFSHKGLEKLTRSEILEVMNHPKRGLQIQKCENGLRAKETSIQLSSLVGQISQEELDQMPLILVALAHTDNLTHANVHYGNHVFLKNGWSRFSHGTPIADQEFEFLVAQQIFQSVHYGLFPPHLDGKQIESYTDFDPEIIRKLNISYYGQDYRYDKDGYPVRIDDNMRWTGVVPLLADVILRFGEVFDTGQFLSQTINAKASQIATPKILESPAQLQALVRKIQIRINYEFLKHGFDTQSVILNSIVSTKGEQLLVPTALVRSYDETDDRFVQKTLVIKRIIATTAVEQTKFHLRRKIISEN